MSSYCFYSVCCAALSAEQKLLCKIFLWCQAKNGRRAALTSLQKDFGITQGRSQELLSTGGIKGGHPPAGGGDQIEDEMFPKE